MALNEWQQINSLFQERKNIAIIFRKESSGDAAAGALALSLFLEKNNKLSEIISEGFALPEKLKFLKKADTIKPAFSYLQKFILNLNIEKTGLQELSYDIKENKLRIFITPKQGLLTKNEITTARTDFRYDLIVIIGSPDLESLGSLYQNNTEMFYQTPIINIDYRPGNERFGQVNYIDFSATSTCEVVYKLLSKINPDLIDEPIASSLLTGMIINSRSFKSENVKPTTMATAAKLIELGANRENIIQNLYHTRNIATLQLWGEALAHLQTDNNIGLVWTTLTRESFARSGSTIQELYDIIDEVIINSPQANKILILHEQNTNNENVVFGILRTLKGVGAKDILSQYYPQGDQNNVSFTIKGKSLKEAEEEVLKVIKS